MGGKRLRFTDAERYRLARKVHAPGRRLLNQLDTVVALDTLTRWYRELVAAKWDFSIRVASRNFVTGCLISDVTRDLRVCQVCVPFHLHDQLLNGILAPHFEAALQRA